MLKRTARRLPKQFNRRVGRSTLSFVKRRHARTHRRSRSERMRGTLRRFQFRFSHWVARARRWSLLILLILFFSLSGFIIFSPIIQVREIRVQRTEGRVDVGRIQEALSPYFGRHLLFLPAIEIRNAVRQVVPDLADVSITKKYPSQLFLKITLKPLIAQLKIDGPAASGATLSVGSGATVQEVRRYDYLTENGMYVATATSQSGSTLPLIHIVDWAARPVPNTQLITPEFYATMQKAEKALVEEFGKKIGTRTVLIQAQEFHLMAGPLAIWFDTRSPLADQLQRYRTFLRNVPPGDVKQYVDLRLQGKVVYR